MDNEMIERGAKAMQEKRRELIAQPLERIWPELMKAAVLAIREPTENLIEFHTKGDALFDRGDLFDWNCNCYYCGGHKFAVQSYIDAIIGDK